MNSKNLTETGFSVWFPLKTITHSNLPADAGVVIAIVDSELSDKPESDILYIGRTKKPAKRILGGYLAGYGGKNTKKINQMLMNEGYMEKVSISWVATDKPRIMQEELLAKFKEEHGELPAWNDKKKLAVKPKAAAVRTKKAKTSKGRTAKKSASKIKTKDKKSAKKATAATAKTEMPSEEVEMSVNVPSPAPMSS